MNTEHDLLQKIIQRRKELGISQQKLADMISLPQSTIARIEAEIVSPRLETIILIANALGISINIK
ncbi:MAG: helix-turn-helix transcriptional regulator [Bacilli bacterium]|nr:helix-turn-helix transcriptional regulator [Bacilli bacterium]